MLLNKRISILYFIRLIKFDIAFIGLYAVLASNLDQSPIFQNLVIPLSIPGIIGTLVSLLLAFRTSQSYERWWEARIAWGAIVNDSRTFIRQLIQFLPDTPEAKKEIAQFTERQIIWNYALAESLRKSEYSERTKSYLLSNNITQTNIPNALLLDQAKQLARVCQQYQINVNLQVQIDSTLARLTDSMGRCERIKNTVFPKSYGLLIHFLIYVFLLILPFGFENSALGIEILFAILLPTLYIAIEKTAILMQDPFENRPTDTPMTKIAQTIENNLREMIGLSAIEFPDTSTYYVM